MVSVRQGWIAGVMFGLGMVLVGASWAREPSGAVVAPALGELELELRAGEDSAPSATFELEVRGTSAGSEIRRAVVLEAAASRRVQLRLPAGAYAVTLNAAALPEPADATALLPRLAEPGTRWLDVPMPEVVLVAPGRTTRANVVMARPPEVSIARAGER